MNILLLGRKHIAKSEDIISAMKHIGIAVDFLLVPNFHYAESDSGYDLSTSGGEARKVSAITVRSRIFYYLYHFSNILFLLGKYFRKNKYDILFAIDWFEGAILLAYRFLFARKAKVIFYGYDYYFHSSKFSSRYIINRIDAWVARHVDEAWVVNNAIRIEREKQEVFARSTTVVPLGIADKKLSWEIRNDRHFLFVGNCKEGHNLLKLVDIFTDLTKSDRRFELTIVGRGNLFESLARKIRELGAESNIHLRGFLSEEALSQEIRAGSFAAGIALYEKTREIATVDPGKIKDYLSWRLPVLVTAFNPISEEVRSFDIGYVAENDERKTLLELFRSVNVDDLRAKQEHGEEYIKRHSFEEALRQHLFSH